MNRLPEHCAAEGCDIAKTWNGKPIVLHLDHINGVKDDNRVENLRLLCPNCHSQTSTYAGRNARVERKPLARCRECRTPVTASARLCRPCSFRRRQKIDWPPADEVLEMVEASSWLATGRELGVSDNAVRKYVARYGPNGT